MNWIIETQRLRLREFDISDTEMFFKLNADPNVMHYTGDKPFNSIQEAQDLILNYTQYQENGYGRWTVVSKDKNETLGWCGLKLHDEGFVDIGFRFFQKDWGKGYATEAAKACMDFGFNQKGIAEIIGRSSENNKASIRVLEKIGMQFWKKDEALIHIIKYKPLYLKVNLNSLSSAIISITHFICHTSFL